MTRKRRRKPKAVRAEPRHPARERKRKQTRWRLLWQSNLAVSVFLFVLALVVRLVYLVHLERNSPVAHILIHDSALFNHLAHKILSGHVVLDKVFYISPLYSYFLAVVYALLGDSFTTVRVVQFVLGSVGVVVFFDLARRYLPRGAAFASAVYAALYAPFLFFEGSILGTSVALLLLLLAVWLAAVFRERPAGWIAFLSGLALGLGSTGRPNALLMAFALGVAFWVWAKGKRRWVPLLVWFVGVSIPIGATVVHNYLAGHDFVVLTTHGGINFYIGNHKGASGVWEAPEGMEASVSAINLEEATRVAEQHVGHPLKPSQVSDFWYGQSLRYIVHHPLDWLLLLAKKLILFFDPYEVPLNFEYAFHQQFSWLLRIPLTNFAFLMPFAVLGLVLAWPERRRFALLYGVVALYTFSVVLFFVSGRYRLMIVPYFIIFGSYGVLKLGEAWQKRTRWALWGSLVFVAFLSFSLYSGWRQSQAANFGNEYYNLCVAHLNEGHVEDAIYWGRKAIIADPTIVNAHYNLGLALYKRGNYREATKAFEYVVKLDSTEASAWGNLGGLYLLAGRIQKALKSLQRSIALDSTNVTVWLNLGRAYYELGDYEKAWSAWVKALRLDPENPVARQNLEVLRSMGYGREEDLRDLGAVSVRGGGKGQSESPEQ